MNKRKLFNDPVYGFITLPYPIIFDLIEHPYMQRMRRIMQLGLTHYVYPGALHTRFHHALGALHLMTLAIDTLRAKGVSISDEEAQAVCIGILLHDIGHGPFSHTLEHSIVPMHHEELSVLFMQTLNAEFGGALSLAIDIFTGNYHKPYLHQLISSQLDMDRLDYLNRDSFFTGVSEGVIGYDRIIKMLTVVADELVVEEKGIYSIENFLIARRLMYWQVYLHKTVLSAEQMLVRFMQRVQYLVQHDRIVLANTPLNYFLKPMAFASKEALLHQYAKLDDLDIFQLIKIGDEVPDTVLPYLSKGLLHRKLLKIRMANEPFSEEEIGQYRRAVQAKWGWSAEEAAYVVFTGQESNSAYKRKKDEIKILLKTGQTVMMSALSEHAVPSKTVTKYYLCYPKEFHKQGDGQ